MDKSSSTNKPKKKSKRFYTILAVTVLLLALLAGVVIFEWSNLGRTNYGPGPVDIEVTTDKTFYLQGEEVHFNIYVNNPQDWQVGHPTTVAHEVNEDNQSIYSDHFEKDYGDSWPAFPAHSKTLFETYSWNQKNINGSSTEPGNYTLTVTFYHGLIDYGNAGTYSFEVQ
jgi:hypothetical protein